MTKEEYIKAKISAGHELHFNDGVWWQNTKKGYCKPAIFFDEIDTRKSRPALSKSYIGYNHRIRNSSNATGFWEPFIMKGDKIMNWEVNKLKSKGRKSSIKKGVKINNIIKVKSIEGYKQPISDLLKSVAARIKHGHPVEYYNMNNLKWWDTLIRVSEYSEFWCAFKDDELTGYISIHVMGNKVMVDGVKVHSDWLNNCVVDAILYEIIQNLKERGTIEEIWYGGRSDRPSLDKFKTSYGFELVQVPYQIRLLGGFIKFPKFINDLRSTSET